MLNKCDALTPEQRKVLRAELEAACGAPVAELSGVSGLGKDDLIGELFRRVSAWRDRPDNGPDAAVQGGVA